MAKALSIRQPWAWAILHAGKDVENRTWSTNYRGLLVVHASKTIDRPWPPWLRIRVPPEFQLHTGVLLGTVQLVGCTTDHTSWWGDPDVWHWQLTDPRPFADPIPWRGMQGLFTVPDEILPTVVPDG